MIFPEPYRTQRPGYTSQPGDPYGWFVIPARAAGCGRILHVLACDGLETGWEHVSVSIAGRPDKCPSWPEMCAVKALFWSPAECVVQFHPPASEYVNVHPGCLHLWRRVGSPFPMPPKFCV